MKKFHINNNHEVKPCAARVKCDFGGEQGFEHHYYDAQEAQLEADSRNKHEYGLTTTLKRQRSDFKGVEFEVEDNAGDNIVLVGGELTPEAEHIFLNGQCLAMATELAKHFETNQLFTVSYIEEGEDLLWDDEKDDFLLDEDGNEIPETYEVPHHIYAIDQNGDLWDVQGKLDRQEAENHYKEKGYILTAASINESAEKNNPYMSEQEYDFAHSMISEVIKD